MKLRKTLLAAGLALGIAPMGAHAALGITIDPDGLGPLGPITATNENGLGIVNIGLLLENAVRVSGELIPGSDAPITPMFTDANMDGFGEITRDMAGNVLGPRILIMGQANPNNGPGADLITFELSLPVATERFPSPGVNGDPDVIGSRVDVTAIPAAISFGGDNYFRLFSSPAGIDQDKGEGYGSGSGGIGGGAHAGTLILDAKIQLKSAGSIIQLDGDGTADTVIGPTASALGFDQLLGSFEFGIDICTATEIAGGPTAGDLCAGQAAASFIHSDYIDPDSLQDDLTLDIDFQSFGPATPSTDPVPDTYVGVTPDLTGSGGHTNTPGALDDLQCEAPLTGTELCDIVLLNDQATLKANLTLPEPGTLGLLGATLLGFGAARRRKA